MHKFRSEAWCRPLQQNRDWTTCYGDYSNGYGHFYSTGDMYQRKQPRTSDRPTYSLNYLDRTSYQKPNTDHMWDVLHVWGSHSVSGNPREQLRRLLRERCRQRLTRTCPSPHKSPDIGHNRGERRPRETQILKLPQVIKDEKSENLMGNQRSSPQIRQVHTHAGLTSYQETKQGRPKAYNVPLVCERDFNYNPPNFRNHDTDSDSKSTEWYANFQRPVAGLPTVWPGKQRHKVNVPPPYVSQPIPLPMHVTFRRHIPKTSRSLDTGENANLEYVLVPRWRMIQSFDTQTDRPTIGQLKLAHSNPALPPIQTEQRILSTYDGSASPDVKGMGPGVAIRQILIPQIATSNE